ncbi:LutC/YkgG family protein [Desulfitobacterium sp. AusDCA]|uniref:LutC/YkgG family protein n=1 Tax=Desulfitobacterium sp. AusDCA TaxID=3240383 RepID=UPI003DA6E904
MKEIDNLYDRFKSKLEAVSGECYRANTAAGAQELICQLLLKKGIHSVAMVDSPLAKECDLAHALPAKGISLHMDNYPKVTATAEAGITEMKWAIAELGTLVQYAVDPNERLCSSFTPIHLALVKSSALLTNLPEALSVIHKEPQIPGFVGFITGPSRTSDIERVLTIGVHGPGELIAIFVDDSVEEVK